MNTVEPIRDPEKVEALKEYFKQSNKRNYIMFLLGINTGLRISDILRLQVKHIKNIYIVIREKKTNKEKRIRMTPSLRKEILLYIEGKDDNQYLIPSRQGNNKPLSRSMAYKILKEASVEFNLVDLGTHSLRKTMGYHFYKQTKDIAMLQDLFNHSSSYITKKYIGINQDAMDKAMVDFKI